MTTPMKGTIIWLFVLLVTLILAACNSQSTNHSEAENAEATQYEADAIVSMFQSVLLNERQFYNRWAGWTYLDDYSSELRDATAIALFDMNGDGAPEVIVNFHYAVKLVLRYFNGEVFGDGFGIRDINGISTDGRFFMNFGGAGSFGIGELIIDGETANISMIYSFEAQRRDRQYINGISVSAEEFELRRASLDEKECIAWHSFTQENIRNLASLITPRYMPAEYREYQSEYIFTTTMRIHEDMPVFTFHRIVGDYAPEPWHEIPQPREVSIIVKDENGAIIQVISDLTQSSRYGTQGIAFDDFNFDGYLDMRLLRFQDGAGGRLVTEYIWLWDRSASQFALNRQLMDIENAGLSANQYTRRIEAFHRAGADHFFTFFEYHDGEFARIPD